jgi:hypothetical protein
VGQSGYIKSNFCLKTDIPIYTKKGGSEDRPNTSSFVESTPSSWVIPVSFPELDVGRAITAEKQLINQRSEATLHNHRKDTLQAMSFARSLPTGGSKRELVKALFKWVCFFYVSTIYINKYSFI